MLFSSFAKFCLVGPHGGRWGERSTDYTPDEVDSIIMNRIKQAESIRHNGKTSSNGNLATKRDTRVKERVNYTEDFPDVVQEKTQQELDVEFRQKRLATALVITEKEHKFMVSLHCFRRYLTKFLVSGLFD